MVVGVSGLGILRSRATLATCVATTLGLFLLSKPDMAFAVSPNGSQFQVNTYTTNVQGTPSVASDSSGNFVVVWESNGSAGTDTASLSMQGQRYDATGAPVAGQFQINTYTTSGQYAPSVASDSSGNFVVVWESRGSGGGDTAGKSVQAQRYNASGSAIGGQFQVNTFTTLNQAAPSVASDPTGNFVVAWDSSGSLGSDTSQTSVQGQRYGASGSPAGGQFQINTFTSGGQYAPSVASDSSGNFVVVWENFGVASATSAVQGQRYDASGSPIGSEFQVNSYTTGSHFNPSVASDSSGKFVVVWTSHLSAGSDSSGYSIQGQRYDASGLQIGGQFQVNTYTTANQRHASVASDSLGNFVVVWESNGSAGGDTAGYSVQGQPYDAAGSPIGGQFQVNAYTTNNQLLPSVASDAAGRFVVTWESKGSAGSDASDYSVQGQRYLPEPGFVPGLGAMLAMVILLARRRWALTDAWPAPEDEPAGRMAARQGRGAG
jgi:hypothetical protein